MLMTIEVLTVFVLPATPPVVNSIRYDLTIPLGVIGGCQFTIIDVELMLCDVTFTGALGAVDDNN